MATVPKSHHLSSNVLYDMTGLVALITGGGSGIGLMIAEAYAVHGATVYIGGRREQTLDKAASDVAQRIGNSSGRLVPLGLDVTKKESIRNAVNIIREKEGKLHILVNNAGQVGPFSGFFNDESAPEHADIGTAVFENEHFADWASLFDINITSIFFTTFAFLPLLELGAQDLDSRSPAHPLTTSVINITSVSGIQRQAQMHFAYNVSKAAANHLTRLLSTELALKKKPVRVNAIAPGPFPTEMTEHQGQTFGAYVADMIGKGIHPHPARRGGTEEEIAGAALLLASPVAGGYINGHIMLVDGGFLLVNPGST
ncbi:related to NAD(P)H-dependent oxidoreductase [Serendipita indica DSM 11827]|uniref:Related to NAD(P)H-dependent oxidoreductase n=1 Tax=Serendipita indica (strain DSM 11827) TaxID=1109443 RepID=G4TT72_SERID|nr:related to NAD(P)H-dependent oxidoreductase [Serendipita indica DSM 11827]